MLAKLIAASLSNLSSVSHSVVIIKKNNRHAIKTTGGFFLKNHGRADVVQLDGI